MNWQTICPEFLKKRLFRHLLHHFIGSFFKETLSLDQLAVNFYNGTASIENLHLDCDHINRKLTHTIPSLPIEIISGFVGSISVYIPWHDITNQDCILTLKDTHLILKIEHNKSNNITNTGLIESVIENTTSLSESIMNESLHLAREYVQNETDFSNKSLFCMDTFSSTIKSILSHVKIKLENTFIRIEPLTKSYSIEIEIKQIDYLYIDTETTISSTVARLFKLNQVKVFSNETSIVDLNESILTSNSIELISLNDEILIYLKTNKSKDPNVEISIEIGSIKSSLTLKQISFLNELFNDLNGNCFHQSENTSNLSSSQNDIYYSFISNDSESRRNSFKSESTNTFDEFKQQINSIDQLFKTFSFEFKIKMFNLKLILENFESDYFLIDFQTIHVLFNQKDNKNQTINQLNLTIDKTKFTHYDFPIFDTNVLDKALIQLEFESLTTKENFRKYENFLVEINQKIIINLTETTLTKLLNLFKILNEMKKFKSKNEYVKSIDLIFNESIEVYLNLNNSNLKLIMSDFHLNKFHDLNIRLKEANLSMKTDENLAHFKEFFRLKEINFIIENNTDEISVVKFKKLDTSTAHISLDNGIEEYSPFSTANCLISNESNTQIIQAGNKYEIEQFIQHSLKQSNNLFDFKISDLELLVYDQTFLAQLISNLVNLKQILTNSIKNKSNAKTTLLINVKSSSVKAYYSNNNFDYTEFYSSLNSIHLCINWLFRTKQISLQIDQFNLSNLNHLKQADYTFPLLSSNNTNLILDFNNNFKDVNQAMITLAIRCKPNKTLISLNLDMIKFCQRFTSEQTNQWFNQLIVLIGLIQFNKRPVQNDLHLNITNSCIEYKPHSLDFKSTLSLKNLHFTKLINQSILIIIEDVKLFLAKKYLNVCIAELDLLELSIDLKEKVFKLVSNNIQIKTCFDSASDLICLIQLICKRDVSTDENNINNEEEQNQTKSIQNEENIQDEYSLIEIDDYQIDLSPIEEVTIKKITQKPFIKIINDYFNLPNGNDVFKPPDKIYPQSNEIYHLEISIKWCLFKGFDFKTTKSRVSNEYMQFSFNKIKIRLDLFNLIQSSFFYRLVFGVNEIIIKDNLSDSSYDVFMYRYEADNCPRCKSSPMLFFKLVCFDKMDCESKLSIQPLRFNLDQDSLMFLYQFFSHLVPDLNTSKQLNHSNYNVKFYFRQFTFASDLIVKFNFNGKYDTNVSQLNRLLLPAVQLSNTEIRFKKMIIKNIKPNDLIAKLKEYWLNDIKQSQVMNIIKGWSLFNSVGLFLNGFICLIAYPMEHCERKGRLLCGIHKGSSAFSSCIFLARVDSTNQLLNTSKSLLDYLFNLLSLSNGNFDVKKSNIKNGAISHTCTVLNENLELKNN